MAPQRRGSPELRQLWPIAAKSFDVLVQGERWRRVLRDVLVDDRDLPLPGDSFLPQPTHVATYRLELSAPADQLWPWLAQMFRGGGIYGWRELEAPASRGSERLVTALPPPIVGDRAGNVLRLARVAPRQGLTWCSGGETDVAGVPFAALTLDYEIGGECRSISTRTSLAVRLRCRILHVTASLADHRFALLSAILPVSQLERLKRLAERTADVAVG